MFQSEKTMTLVMLLVPLVWALSGVSAKYLSFYISEDEVVVYRFFLSALSTFPLLIWMKIPIKISLKNFLICILLAFFLIGNYRTYFMGMQRGGWFRRGSGNRFDSNFCLYHNDFFKKIKWHCPLFTYNFSWRSNSCTIDQYAW